MHLFLCIDMFNMILNHTDDTEQWLIILSLVNYERTEQFYGVIGHTSLLD